jgi:hypothetical protein
MAKQRQSRPKAKLREEDDRSGMRIARQVVIVAVPPVRAVDVFGPAEVFGDANWLRGGDPCVGAFRAPSSLSWPHCAVARLLPC